MTEITSPAPARQRCPLDPLELDIVKRLAAGEIRTAIARAMGISGGALNSALSRMYAKTEASNPASLVAVALRQGWIR